MEPHLELDNELFSALKNPSCSPWKDQFQFGKIHMVLQQFNPFHIEHISRQAMKLSKQIKNFSLVPSRLFDVEIEHLQSIH